MWVRRPRAEFASQRGLLGEPQAASDGCPTTVQVYKIEIVRYVNVASRYQFGKAINATVTVNMIIR